MKARAIKARIVAAVLISTALVLISLNAGSGGLEPTAPPGPTMHTLDEIYTAVTSSSEQETRTHDAYLKFEGVDGESVDDKHKDWIDVLNWSWGVLGPGVPTSGGTTTEAEAKEFIVTKWVDKSSPLLYLACCKGEHYPSVILSIVEPTSERGQYMQFKMEDVIISSVVAPGVGSPSPTSTGGSDRPQEDISLNYSKVEWTYTLLDPNGAPTTKIINTNFDFTTSNPY